MTDYLDTTNDDKKKPSGFIWELAYHIQQWQVDNQKTSDNTNHMEIELMLLRYFADNDISIEPKN